MSGQPLLIPAFNPGPMTGHGNNTYLLTGATSVLIDAGVGNRQHIEAIGTALSAAPGPLSDVLVTHGHPDHASGSAALQREWPSARFWKCPWPDQDGRFGVRFERLSDGQSITTGADRIRVLHTPGHSPDHCCFWLEATRTLLSGDLVQESGTVVIPASRGGNMTAYLASLRRVAALEPARLLPAHGGPIDRPLELVKRYLDHRQEREGQVLQAIKDGHSTVEAIVARVYPVLADAFSGAAHDTVLAHLHKLDDESRAEQVGGHWRALSGSGAASTS